MKLRTTVPIFILVFILLAGCRLQGNSGKSGQNQAPQSSLETAQFMDRYVIDQDAHPLAVCNDGTTPVFYFRRGVGEDVDKWIIWFKGGGAGYSAETMRSRGKTVTSSDPWMTEAFAQIGSGGNQGSPDGEAGGIMSSVQDENPDFYTWNHAYLVYCSSDGWTGTRAASEETGGYHFAGSYILDAMFDALRSEQIVGSPNLADATTILLSGSSAGSLGLRSNLDRLATSLSFADVRAISDAGVHLYGGSEMQSYADNTIHQQYDMWQPRLDDDCVADQTDQPWVCLNGGIVLQNGYIQTEFFIHQDQSDTKIREAIDALGLDEGPILDLIGQATRALLEQQDGVFSPNAGRHIIINTNRFSKFKLDGYSFAEIFGNWYFGRSGPTLVIEYP